TMLAFYGVYNYTGPHIVSELGAPTWIAGMLALTYGGGFGAAVLLDSQIDRIGARRAAPAVFAVLMTIYGAIALTAGQLWVLLAVGFGWGIINHLSLNLIVGRLTALDPAQRGAILGLYSAVTYAAVTIGTLGFRPAYDAAGLAACAWIAVVLVAAMVTEAATRKA
ncbi:MAG: MFS transporter, partial [Pseudomonadota bacterium]